MRRALLLLLALSIYAEESKTVVIRAAHMVDPRSGTVVGNPVVVIEGEKIRSVGGQVPADAQVIDLGNATILPGLIDCHTHITSNPGNYYDDLFRRSAIDFAVVAHVYAQRTLEAGFTTIRDVGANEFIDVA